VQTLTHALSIWIQRLWRMALTFYKKKKPAHSSLHIFLVGFSRLACLSMRRPIVSVASPTRLPKHTPPGTGGGVHHLPSPDGRPAAICDARSTEDAASTLAGLVMAAGVSSNAVVAPNAAAPPGQVILVCHPGYQSYITGY
jgi:hypothetical protein